MQVEAVRVPVAEKSCVVGPTLPHDIEVRPIQESFVPEEQVVEMGFFVDGVLVGRFPVLAHMAESVASSFESPVSMMFRVSEDEGGVTGTLYAFVPRGGARREDWRFGGSEAEVQPMVGVPVGQYRRLRCEREYPDSLTEEATGFLEAVLAGEESGVGDGVLRDLGL